MKKYFNIAIAMLIAAGLSTSCKDYLDINDDPNNATSVEPQLVLPTAIVRSASLSNSYSNYGANLGGMLANAGGFSGFGLALTYNLEPGSYSQWGAYDVLTDYKYVLDGTEDDNNLANFNAIAKIMMALEFSRLVDQHGDIPYSEALLGSLNLTPKYDSASSIYEDVINKLDEAIQLIDNASFPLTLNAASDPMFQGNMTNWKRFANTLKLRLLIRVHGTSELGSFASQKLSSFNTSLGLITDDVMVNPGYENQSGKVNPTWASWGYTVTGSLSNSSYIPAYFMFGFYDGGKLNDPIRGRKIYNDFGNTARPTPVNQRGVESGNPAVRAGFAPFYNNSTTANQATDGVVKGPTAGQPIMTLAEANFLLAEAQLKGLLSGNAQTSFEAGIMASLRYLHKSVTNALPGDFNAATLLSDYKALNPSDHKVQYSIRVDQGGSSVPTTNEQKLEAIITQKYIALNMINSEEAWNDYRRTGYPLSQAGGGRYVDMASTTSIATTPDRLPRILIYPTSEYNYNAGNVKTINPFTDKVFWAK